MKKTAYDNTTGYYVIRNVNSSLVLDVSGGSRDNAANVRQYTSNGTFAQKWAVITDTDGSISLINARSGLALDVCGGQSANGTNIQQYASNGTEAQKWTLA